VRCGKGQRNGFVTKPATDSKCVIMGIDWFGCLVREA
jgi:hypothetical protein